MSYAASDVAPGPEADDAVPGRRRGGPMDCVAMLIAVYCEQVGVGPETLNSCLQINQRICSASSGAGFSGRESDRGDVFVFSPL